MCRYITEERFGAAFHALQFIAIVCRAINLLHRRACIIFIIAQTRAGAREGGPREPCSGTLLSKIACSAQLLRQRQRRQRRQKKKHHYEPASEKKADSTPGCCLAKHANLFPLSCIQDSIAVALPIWPLLHDCFALSKEHLSHGNDPFQFQYHALPPIRCRRTTDTTPTVADRAIARWEC